MWRGIGSITDTGYFENLLGCMRLGIQLISYFFRKTEANVSNTLPFQILQTPVESSMFLPGNLKVLLEKSGEVFFHGCHQSLAVHTSRLCQIIHILLTQAVCKHELTLTKSFFKGGQPIHLVLLNCCN